MNILNSKRVKLQATTDELKSKYADMGTYVEAYLNKDKEVKLSNDMLAMSKEADKWALDFVFAEAEKRSGVTLSEKVSIVELNNVQFQRAFLQVMDILSTAIYPTIAQYGKLDLLAEFKYGEYGETFKFTNTPNAIYLPSKVDRGRKRSRVQRMFSKEFTVNCISVKTTVAVNLVDLLTGRYPLAKEIIRMTAGQTYYELCAIYDLATTALESIAELGDGYSQDNFINMTDVIAANNGGRVVALMTRLAASKILPENANAQTNIIVGDDYTVVGYVTRFMNVDIIVLDQIRDWTGTITDLKFDNNKIFLITPDTDKIVKICHGGTTNIVVDETTENANGLITATITKEIGADYISNSIGAILTLS